MKYIRFLIFILITSSLSNGYSQINNDTLKQILSSNSFTIEEEYIGDWGGHFQTFIFKKENNMLRIKCKNPNPMINTEKELDTLVSINVLKNLEEIFLNCSERIKTSKNGSTEHIIYKFKNKNSTYIIDDKFTMECHADFKAWKELIVLGMTKTEVTTIGLFDGVFIGKTGYKINEYYISLGDITPAQVDSLKGKKIIVKGKLKTIKGNENIQSSNESKTYITEPKFTIYYETREPLIK